MLIMAIKLNMPMKITCAISARDAQVFRQVECYWVGFGYPSRRKSKRPRRFLRVRGANGICRYFYWTEPDKGKELIAVSRFKKRVQISWDKVTKHYNKNKK